MECYFGYCNKPNPCEIKHMNVVTKKTFCPHCPHWKEVIETRHPRDWGHEPEHPIEEENHSNDRPF